METRRCWSNPAHSSHGPASICASFAQSRKGAPPIFFPKGGHRPKQMLKLDQKFRGVANIDEFGIVLEEQMSQDMDAGSLVIALAAASKLIDERIGTKTLQRLASWHLLLQRILNQMEELEPRGLSMVATAAAKLAWRDELLFTKLAQAGVCKGSNFSITDVAKMTWAFAKVDWVEEAMEFWSVMEKQVIEKIQSGKFIEVSMIAWAFASAEVGSKSMYEATSQVSIGMIDEFPTQCLSNIAWAFAKANVSDKPLFEAICHRAHSLTAEFKDFHAVHLCWALATVDCVDFELFEALSGELVHRSLVKGFSLSMLPELAVAFAKAGMPHRLLFADMADYLSKHVHVAETRHIAVLAWAFATLDLRLPLVWSSLACAAKGGKLWSFPAEDLVTICWAFARVRWCDIEFFMDIVQIATHRIHEFDGDCLANLISAIVCIRDGSLRGILEQGFFDDLLALLFDRYRSRGVDLQLDGVKAVVRGLGRVSRFEDAWSLAASFAPGFRLFLPTLLLEATRLGDGVRIASLWQELAAETKDPLLQSACSNCAVMSLMNSGKMEQASGLLEQMRASGQLSPVSASLAKRIEGDTSKILQACANQSVPERTMVEERKYMAYSTLLRQVLSCAIPGDIDSVLAAIGGSQCAGASRKISNPELDNIIIGVRPRLVVEVGVDCCHTSLQIKVASKGHPCRIISLEADPINAAVVQNVIEFAGLSADISVLVGPPQDSLRSVLQYEGRHSIGMFVHHGGNESAYLRDLREAADLGLLSQGSDGGCTLLADHVLWPGSPSLLWQLLQSGHCHIQESENFNDWMVICLLDFQSESSGATFLRSEVVEPLGFPSLVAEAESWWRLLRAGENSLCSIKAENFRSRLRALVHSFSCTELEL